MADDPGTHNDLLIYYNWIRKTDGEMASGPINFGGVGLSFMLNIKAGVRSKPLWLSAGVHIDLLDWHASKRTPTLLRGPMIGGNPFYHYRVHGRSWGGRRMGGL